VKKAMPPRVDNVEAFWHRAPPERSARCSYWEDRIYEGWSPSKRVRAMGYYEAADFFGVYIWEWLNVLLPLMRGEK
jgi:hypothetical protein